MSPSTPSRHLGFASPHACRPARSVRRSSGFTLMEILVVLAIIGLLAGLTITNIGGLFDGAKISTARLFVQQTMKTPLMAYKFQMSDFPSTAEGLQALIVAPANKADRWRAPFLTDSKVPLDPWGEPYQYRYPGTKNKGSYDLYSKGPDRIDGNEDDIGNWDPEPAPAAK